MPDRLIGPSMLDVGALYVKHEATVAGYFRRRLSDADVAVIEDLVADVFERACRAAPRYEDRGATVDAWLRRIAHNLLVDRFRSRTLRTVSLDAIRPVGVGSDLERLVELRVVLPPALAQLTPAQRAVIRARFLAGLSIRETAATTGRSELAVRSLQERGLARLRRLLEVA